jgi:chromosome segregation ATPase
MNRFVQAVNLLGVLALAALCAVQWRVDGQLHSQINDLEKTNQDLTSQVAQRDERIRQDADDLDDFRRRLTLAESQLADQERKLTALSLQCQQLTADRTDLLKQRDQLVAALQTWKAAVTERDDAIRRIGDELKTTGANRDQIVAKYNDLVNQYNAVVNELNNARAVATRP